MSKTDILIEKQEQEKNEALDFKYREQTLNKELNK